MHKGRNSVRRNRNIGTKAQGHGKNNRLVVPSSWWTNKTFTEQLDDAVEVTRIVHARPIRFLVQPTRRGCAHSCTVNDVTRILRLLPADHTRGIGMVVFRQATRKQEILQSVWGRMIYAFNTRGYFGPAVMLEATQEWSVHWGRHLKLEDMRELKRLEQEGHNITRTRRGFHIQSTLDTNRNTQLYETVIHEVGHHVDYVTSVDRGTRRFTDINTATRRMELYNSIPTPDKEAFAHNYAQRWRRQMQKKDVPFERIFNAQTLRSEGLDPDWFRLPHPAS